MKSKVKYLIVNVIGRYRICILLISILFLNCSNESNKKVRTSHLTPKYGGTFRLLQEAPQSLDPLYLEDVYESSIVNQIFEGLLTFDNNLNLKPGLAEFWEISADKLTYTFYIRKGVKFHNNRELTADDFVKSFLRILKTNPTGTAWSHFLVYLKGIKVSKIKDLKSIEGLQSIDRYTFRIRLTKPVSVLLDLIASENFYVIPVEEVEKNGELEFSRHPIGCGPFKFISWTDKTKITLVANSDYYFGRPYLDTLVFNLNHYTIDESISQFLDSKIDLVYLSANRYNEFNNDNYKILSRPEMSTSGLGFDLNKYPFNIAKLRQAISYAIDNESCFNDSMYGDIPAKSILPTFMSKFIGASIYKRYDIQKAKKLLAEAGFENGKNLGVLELWTSNNSYSEFIITSLAKLGLKVITKQTEWEQYVDILDEKKASMFTFTWVADYPDPHSFYCNLLNSNGSDNYFNFKNKSIDSLLSVMHQTPSIKLLNGINQNIEKIVSESVPFIPLVHSVNNYVTRRSVMDFNINSYGLAGIKLKNVWLNN
jgi:oligopeptide transport system substrate-binding protein